ncbi:hypothetical protein AB0J86_20275 [Micromonospora sp. NPDC049559]|uniref:hypothetical protein n=1 Tax=Micromonospora sp. NPDC049559 TaxID=3155923 RepID=UPI003439245D
MAVPLPARPQPPLAYATPAARTTNTARASGPTRPGRTGWLARIVESARPGLAALLLGLAAVLLVLAVPAPARAGGDDPSGPWPGGPGWPPGAGWPGGPGWPPGPGLPVLTHFTDDGGSGPSTLPCPGGQAIRGNATFGVQAGDTWQGGAVYDLCLRAGPQPNSLVYHGTGTFTGAVTGCGTGTFRYEVVRGFARLLANPTAPNGRELWRIVPGSGTGGLAGVTAGRGVGVYTIQQSLANQGFFAGRIAC